MRSGLSVRAFLSTILYSLSSFLGARVDVFLKDGAPFLVTDDFVLFVNDDDVVVSHGTFISEVSLIGG